jgi:hypothetical protein
MVIFGCFGGGLVLSASDGDGLERGKKREKNYTKRKEEPVREVGGDNNRSHRGGSLEN